MKYNKASKDKQVDKAKKVAKEKEYRKKYYLKNKDKAKEYARSYYCKNKNDCRFRNKNEQAILPKKVAYTHSDIMKMRPDQIVKAIESGVLILIPLHRNKKKSIKVEKTFNFLEEE